MHFIVYDEDRLLESLLVECSPIFNFTFELIDHLEQLKDKCAAKKLDALILVEKEHLEKYIPFLELCNAKSFPIAYFGKTSVDARSFRRLKQEFHVEYVLEQPLDKNEASALLRIFCFEKKEGEEKKEYLTPELLEKYKEKIFEKIERIEELAKNTGSAQNLKDNLLEMRNEIHKITGNAAPYGYPEAGKLCGAHEIYLYNLYSGNTTQELPQILLQNELFLRKLKLLFQKIYPRYRQLSSLTDLKIETTEWKRRTSDEKKEGVLLHLITMDFDLARYVQSAAAKKHMQVVIDDNPDNYLENFASLEKLPYIILVEENYPFNKWDGVELIKALKKIDAKADSLFGILTDRDNLDKRIEWMKEGIDLIIKKPVTDANLEYILSRVFEKHGNLKAKVLILDDDEEQGILMKNILESAKISAIYVQDESKLFSTLEEFTPDLLLLDIQMPKYNGKILLNALREEIRFKQLLIVIVTALSSTEIDEWAYNAKCDAVLHKPLNIPVFIARISSLLERHREYYSYQETDSLTGLLLWDSFLNQVELYASQCPKGTKCMLVLLKIDRWESLSGVLNGQEIQQIILMFSELLKSHFYSSLHKGILTRSCFVMLFKDIAGGEIEFLMESFFEKLQTKVWLSSQTHLKIKALASAILFLTGDATIQQVVEEAKKGLDNLQKEGTNRLDIKRIGEKVSLPVRSKRVILVDDDPDLCEIIQFAFEQHNFEISTFHSLGEALHFFAQLPNLDKNTLIILDRRLPDGDGIDILRKIQDKFPGDIKAIFLSSLSNEKEILEALRAGALDYMTKPFSIEVLIEKASILLSH